VSEGGPLQGKVALISGAAGGIGREIVRSMAAAGAIVVGLDRLGRPDELDCDGWLTADLGEQAEVAAAVGELVELHGGLDLLVHAAGLARDRVLWKLPVADWDLVQRVNLRGAFLLMHHAVPVMRGRGGGRIVLIGSINGSRGKFGQTAYSASKAGLIGLAKSAARETGKLGIRVNVVEPGLVDTEMARAMPDEARQAALEETLVGRIAQPGDIASIVLYLCGPSADQITGQVLRVDGGQYL